MSTVRALLVGVCEYPKYKYLSLPLCKNDIYEVQEALVEGLNVNPDNIILCGQNGIVTQRELIESVVSTLEGADEDDIFIFYFSGHGGNKCLALSDGNINLQELLDVFERIFVKSKIIILDSCHSGDFKISDASQINTKDAIEYFVGRGYAVMASCGSEQVSGFNEDRKISLYTSFLCDALACRSLIRKGQKSLEMINESIYHYAFISNKKGIANVQQPIFRSNISGTIFFDVEEYNPYEVEKIYEETEKYIIYEVKPMHHVNVKRLSVKVILRFQSTPEEISALTKEIRNKVLYCEVHSSENTEKRLKGKPANVVVCSFGYDESDMLHGTWAFRTIWVDFTQDRNNWYGNKNAVIINDVCVETIKDYTFLRNNRKNDTDKKYIIEATRECTTDIIFLAEYYIKEFRELLNGTITEQELVDKLHPLNDRLLSLIRKQENMPFLPDNLYCWQQAHCNLSSTTNDFTLYYNKRNLSLWPADSRKLQMSIAIKRYEETLEKLKSADKLPE